MSPRTRGLHFPQNLPALGHIQGIGGGLQRLAAHLIPSTEPHRIDQCAADGFGNTRPIGGQLSQGLICRFVSSEGDDSHALTLRRP